MSSEAEVFKVILLIKLLLKLHPYWACFHRQGSSARMSSFVGAIAIADLVKTTLGPKGMDKILQSVSLQNLVATFNGPCKLAM